MSEKTLGLHPKLYEVYKTIREERVRYEKKLFEIERKTFINSKGKKMVYLEIEGLFNKVKFRLDPRLLKRDVEKVNNYLTEVVKDTINRIMKDLQVLSSDVVKKSFKEKF